MYLGLVSLANYYQSYKLKMKGMTKINDNFFVDKTKSLGQGNFGVVYKGYRLDENRIIAVKFMSEAQLQKNPQYKRELSVMQDLAKLNHPNIMGYYGYQIKPQGLYCFLEFCSGGELKPYCKKKVSEIKALVLFKQLLEAMTYINGLNKIHRDLKPENILLDQNLDLKIADFGLARDLEMCMTKGACTPLYAAPQVYNMLQYDHKCDVWSSGLILYEMLTGSELFKKVKTKADLKEQLDKGKKGQKLFQYPKELHKNWTIITEKMLTYDKVKRPSFKQLLHHLQTIRQQMEYDFNKKYDAVEGIEQQISNSRKRLAKMNPYLLKKANQGKNPDKKLEEESSYQKYQNAQQYLIFFRMKNQFMCKIIKSFTDNPYPLLKNVYKYILMFLAVSCYISKLTESIMDLKNKQVNTPNGLIKSQDIVKEHQKEWQELIQDTKSKHTVSIQRFRNVLEKQIVDKIVKSYMTRDEEKKILGSYANLVEWIQETRKGNFMKARFYMDLYIKVMNDNGVHMSDQKLKTLEMKDLKTYAFIRLTGHLESFLNQKNFIDEDYVRMKMQELGNFEGNELAEYLKIYNVKA